MTDTSDDSIAGYRILSRVFEDPRGEIVIATPEQAPRFADKVVLRISPFAALGSEVSVRDYMRRAALYATLSHSSIIQAYELSTANSAVVLVLEYCEGLALDDFRASLDAISVEIPDEVVFYIGLRTLGALTAAHAARDPGDGSHTPVVHGNVRPECILIPWDGYVRLAEFEVARISAVWRGAAAAARPTASRYMAPEQVNSGLASVKTDVYSVALVLWELLTKMVAVPQSLSGSSLARAMAKPKFAPLGRVRPDLPTKLLSIMDRALAPAAQRTVTAPEMLAVLRELTATDQAEAKLLRLLERVRSAPVVGGRRRASQPSLSKTTQEGDAGEQEATQVGELDLLEEMAIEADSVRPATTPPPLPAGRQSATKIPVGGPPRPRLTPSAGVRAVPRPASMTDIQAAMPATVSPGPLTEPAPPPPAMTERPEPAPASERMPQSERIPRVRESSGRIGLLEWSASSSSEIPDAPGLLAAIPGTLPPALAPTATPAAPPAAAPHAAPPAVPTAAPIQSIQLGGHTLPLLAPMDPLAAQAQAPMSNDAPSALFGGAMPSPAPALLGGAAGATSGVGDGASSAFPAMASEPAPRPSQLSIETFGTFPRSQIPAAPVARGWSRLGYAMLLLVGAGFGVGLYFMFMAGDKVAAKPTPPAGSAGAAVALDKPAPVVPVASLAPSASDKPAVAEPPPAVETPAVVEKTPAVVEKTPEAANEPAVAAPSREKFGTLDTAGAVGDRRIWVDDKVVGQTGGDVKAPCGMHKVKIGSGGTARDVMIPCGGSVVLK